MELNVRQKKIIEIVKENQPITGEDIAKKLGLTRATLRPDLSVLTMSKILDARPRVGYFYVGTKTNEGLLKFLKESPVKDVGSLPIVIAEGKSVYEAIVTLFLEDVGTIYVVKDSYLSGVISRKDLLKTSIGNKDLNTIPVEMVMTRLSHIVYVNEDDSIYEAISKILTYEIDSLPIVTAHDVNKLEVVGRFTKTNISRLLMEFANGN
ncbi:helix-turn-helix transcriptional regulator [Proteinivorax hydrogeniformans]|uniref:Helix-turn-helix transcriptional regulator n=1 Tax=Proteinivorax hydrogeniformans TaxID=1826727 RepID=A0AAU8HRD4_9FIRM